MKLKLIFSDKTYKYLINPNKRKLGEVYREIKNNNGNCRVEYSKKYHNEFEFFGTDDFEYKLKPCIEPKLVKEFS